MAAAAPMLLGGDVATASSATLRPRRRWDGVVDATPASTTAPTHD
jgi:hypothetical protein